MTDFHDAKLLVSAATSSQWPTTDYPEVIFVGRSNAGKSSLINGLLNRKNLAYSSKTPGRTQLLNFFEIDHELLFVDAPGYGYASGGKKQAVDFGRLMEPYFNMRDQLKLLILVLDIRRVPNQEDLLMLEYARIASIPVVVACTKMDRAKQSERVLTMRKITEMTGIPQTSLIPCSSVTGKGLDKIWDQIYRYTK